MTVLHAEMVAKQQKRRRKAARGRMKIRNFRFNDESYEEFRC